MQYQTEISQNKIANVSLWYADIRELETMKRVMVYGSGVSIVKENESFRSILNQWMCLKQQTSLMKAACKTCH